MKNLIFIMMLMLAFSANVFADAPQFKAGTYDPKGELISVTAKGLVCEFCAKTLEKVFLRRDEVAAINVNLTTKEILINLKGGKTLDDSMIEELIKDSGYNIGAMSRKRADAQ